MSDRDPFDSDLDAAFAELRAQAPRPDAALTGRVLADAAAQMPRRRRLADWLVWLPVPAGMAASLAAGLWIGAAVPLPGLEAALESAVFGETLVIGLADPADLLAE